MTKRAKVVILISLMLIVLLVAGNILMIGEAFSGHYDWVCESCQVGLYHCPGKNITYSEVPATYEAHLHSWKLVHYPTKWSPWKPWHWLVYFQADPEFLEEPDPQTLFRSAWPNKYSDEAGLRTLALDPNYEHAEEMRRR